MIEVVAYILGMFGVILVVCGISWMLEMICDGGGYRTKVTNEDLAKMAQNFNDGWFVSENEKGEKFICGYMRD